MAAGNVNIVTGGTITVTAGQAGVSTTSGSITLDANGATSDVVVNDTVTSTGGNINITADRDVIFSVDGDVSSTSGNIVVTADADNNDTA